MSDDKTHDTTRLPLAEDLRISTFSNQWLLRALGDANKVHPYSACHLDYFICGENAFNEIAKDIGKARASVDIICWGFDPAMELVREGNQWPRGITWGRLLREAGERNVKVRLLSWWGVIGSWMQDNMPGHTSNSRPSGETAGDWGAGMGVPTASSQASTDADLSRQDFNALWYCEAFGGRIPNLSLRTRDGDTDAVKGVLGKEDQDPDAPKRGWTEDLLMSRYATHHQKTILIDYELDGGAHAVGYVMGLNSVTDYWDTAEHRFNDPRRGTNDEGQADKGYPGLKPYQDYATRITGAALVAVSKNFSDAWNRAKGHGEKLSRNEDLANPPKGLEQGVRGDRHQLQIVRTQPEEYGGEQTIKRLYWQATEFAQNYIYIENQYFQYTPWAEHLKKKRQEYVNQYSSHGGKGKAPELNLFVVTPTPEKEGMVPRTYDTTKSLGMGDSFPNQDAAIESGRIGGDVAESAKAVGSREDIAQQLTALGLRTLAVSLWTSDPDWSSRNNKELNVARKRAADEAARNQREREVYARQQSGRAEAARRAQEQGIPDIGLGGSSMGAMPPPIESHLARDRVDQLTAKGYREIYIHSKLMLIDDGMFTLGSANLNQRSLAADSEINVASDNPALCRRFRSDVFKQHARGAENTNPATSTSQAMWEAHEAWKKISNQNLQAKDEGGPLSCFIVKLRDKRTSSSRVG